MSIPQTSRIHDIDVGTPPPSLSKYNKWEIINVRYHDFEHLTTTGARVFIRLNLRALGVSGVYVSILAAGQIQTMVW